MAKNDSRDKIDIAFGQALKQCRKYRRKSQESFGEVSSRTYISQIERGISAPTLKKIAMLAKELELEPTTLIAQCCLMLNPDLTIKQLLNDVEQQLEKIQKTR